MIWLYSGTPGSGKSYHATKDVYDRLKKGKRVIANTTYNLNLIKDSSKRSKFTYKDNSELTVNFLMEYAINNHKIGVEGQTLIVIDECSVIFNSRDYSRKDRMPWITFLQQHRKLGYNLILITQNDRMIDRQIRGFVEYEVKHRNLKNFKIFGALLSLLLGGGSLFTAITYWYGMKEKVDLEFIPYRRRVGKFYNTFEIFDESMKQTIDNFNNEKTGNALNRCMTHTGSEMGDGAPPRQGDPIPAPVHEDTSKTRMKPARRVNTNAKSAV